MHRSIIKRIKKLTNNIIQMIVSMRTGKPLKVMLSRFLHLVWYLHTPITFMVKATPHECMQILGKAARPSANRLHLGTVFASGRRYQIFQIKEGFRLTTTSKVSWHYRRRTQSAAVLSANLSSFGDHATRIQLHTRINIPYLLDIFLIPAFITSIVIFVPWQPILIAVIVASLFTLSWINHRANASLEANEMIYFVQKALQDLHPEEIGILAASTPDLIIEQEDFEQEWEKFYETMAAKRPD